MALFVDARILVVFDVAPGEHDAVLVPRGGPVHVAACPCCVTRHADAAALDRLFLERVRGEVPWFTRVVVTGENGAIRSAVETDPVLSARFRLG